MDERVGEILKPFYDQFLVPFEQQRFDEAADIVLSIIQNTRPDPVAYLHYQKASIAHLLQVMAKAPLPVDFEAFGVLIKILLAGAHQGNLPDTRAKSN